MNKGVLFLGTAGDAAVFGKQIRASGGIILKTEQNQFHINPGPGSLVMCRQNDINPRETNSIFLTNQNVLEANDANALIEAMTLDGLDKTGVLVTFKSEEDFVTDYHKSLVERFINLDAGMRIAINDVEIKPTLSSTDQSCGFIFYTPDYVLGVTGKTGYGEKIAKEFKDVNLLIINCKNPEDIEEKNNMNIEDAKKFIKQTKPNLAVLTGFGEKLLKQDIIDKAREVQKSTGVQTISATDGLHINPQNYSQGYKQKRLEGF